MACVTRYLLCSFILCFTLVVKFGLVSGISVQDPCSSSPCLNGGFCGPTINDFVCTCINGYIGLRCEGRSDECSALDSVRCINGRCRLGADGKPTCECNAHFGGQYCDKSLDTCSHTSCKGGTCMDTLAGYQCTCPAGKEGKNCQIDPGKIAKCLASCQTNTTGANGGKCWHNSSETLNVGWGYNQPLCSTMEGCYDMSTKKYDYIDVQLKPIQIQPNDTLVFQTDVDASLYNYKFVPHIIPVEATSSDAFTKCNTTNAIPLANYSGAGSGQLKVNASFLHLGTQYFIANVNALHRCEFGLRLNVTVKENKCHDPISQGAEMCHGHGKCYTDFNKKAYECSCCEGYTGKYCEDEDPCYILPCHNNGKCNIVKDANGKTTFRCKCKQGFLGFDCNQTVDYCESKPCLHSGICVSNEMGFVCQCKNGYYGERCQKTDDQCASNPCQNGATCIDGDDTFTCQCTNGYKGTICEVNIDECATNPCHNGTCIDDINRFQCHCQPGYTGTLCETLQEQCNDIPCNDGKCVIEHSSNRCSCGFGYTGTKCEINLGLCQNTIFCIEENSLACIDHGNHVVCTCKDGYSGSNCGVNINDCANNPCQNGGRCVDKLKGFECICNKGTKGKLCEVMDKTTSKPISTEKSVQPGTTKSQVKTTESLPLEIQIDLQIVTDNCPKLKEKSALETFAKSVTKIIHDACKCTVSANEISPSASTILCSDDLSGKFVTKLRVKDKQEESKIICSLNERIKKGSVPTSDHNTYIVGINSDKSMCRGKKDDDGPVKIDKSIYEQNKKTGIIIGSVVAVIIIIVVMLIVSVKFRNRAVHAEDGNSAKTFLNFAYQSDLELIAPKSAWDSPEQTPEMKHNPYALSYSVKKPKKFHETSFSFENPSGATSKV